MTTPQPISSEELLKFLEGEVTQARAREIEATLQTCPVSRGRLERLEAIAQRLAAEEDALMGVDLVEGVRRGIAQGPGPAAPWWRRAVVVGMAGAVACAAAVLIVLGRVPSVDEAELRPKGAVGSPAAADRWVGIQAFRSTGPDRVEPVGTTIRAGDALMFSYTNLGKEPHAFLMVFAVDGSGAVYWYHPAFTDSRDAPSSLPIAAGATRVELGEMVEHPLKPGPLAIFGLFTREPLEVTDVEQRVGALVRAGRFDVATLNRLPVDGSGQHIIRVEVR